jgi:hypothetical protein
LSASENEGCSASVPVIASTAAAAASAAAASAVSDEGALRVADVDDADMCSEISFRGLAGSPAVSARTGPPGENT